LRLKNKFTIVSGGSRGIGRAICEFFAIHGVKVAVNYSEVVEGDYPFEHEMPCVVHTLMFTGRK